jgi:hypothetical protein
MLVSNYRRSLVRLALVAGLVLTLTPLARSDNQSKTAPFQLTGGDFKLISLTPSAPGAIRIEADFSSLAQSPDIALRLELLQPDGKVAKAETGGSPLLLTFNLSAAELQKFKGKAWQVRLSNDVGQKNKATVEGEASLTFPIATQTILNAKGVDVGGDGAEHELGLKVPNKQGELVVTMEPPTLVIPPGTVPSTNPKLQGLDPGLVVQLVRADGKVLVSKSSINTLTLTHTVSAADLSKGTAFKVRLINNGLQPISNIGIVAKFTPK